MNKFFATLLAAACAAGLSAGELKIVKAAYGNGEQVLRSRPGAAQGQNADRHLHRRRCGEERPDSGASIRRRGCKCRPRAGVQGAARVLRFRQGVER